VPEHGSNVASLQNLPHGHQLATSDVPEGMQIKRVKDDIDLNRQDGAPVGSLKASKGVSTEPQNDTLNQSQDHWVPEIQMSTHTLRDPTDWNTVFFSIPGVTEPAFFV